MNSKRLIIASLICWAISAFVVVGLCRAADVTFSWLPNAETDLTGYKIHYGSSSGTYTEVVDVGLPDIINGRVVYTLKGLPDGMLYYAATAYAGNLESDYSSELSNDPPPAAVSDFNIDIIVNVTVDISQ